MQLGAPDDVDVLIELTDWLFAVEGEEEIAERWQFNSEHASREDMCWHVTFQNMLVKAKSSPKHLMNDERKFHGKQKYPVELVTVITRFIILFKCNRSYSSKMVCEGNLVYYHLFLSSAYILGQSGKKM